VLGVGAGVRIVVASQTTVVVAENQRVAAVEGRYAGRYAVVAVGCVGRYVGQYAMTNGLPYEEYAVCAEEGAHGH
jgi:hypothetical protein